MSVYFSIAIIMPYATISYLLVLLLTGNSSRTGFRAAGKLPSKKLPFTCTRRQPWIYALPIYLPWYHSVVTGKHLSLLIHSEKNKENWLGFGRKKCHFAKQPWIQSQFLFFGFNSFYSISLVFFLFLSYPPHSDLTSAYKSTQERNQGRWPLILYSCTWSEGFAYMVFSFP